MSTFRTHRAVAYAYDIGPVIDALQPYLLTWGALPGKQETLIDHWIAHTVNDFEIVSVDNLQSFGLVEARQLSYFRACVEPIRLLWHALWLPWQLSGSQVVLYRSHRALYLITIDPHA